jgi:hypothetical protein
MMDLVIQAASGTTFTDFIHQESHLINITHGYFKSIFNVREDQFRFPHQHANMAMVKTLWGLPHDPLCIFFLHSQTSRSAFSPFLTC